MLFSQATKVLCRTTHTVGRYPRNSQVQTFFLKRCKQTQTAKRYEEKPKKSRKLVTLAGIAVVGTTIAVIAAKNDEDFREWSKDHLPALDELVKVVYEEDETYLEFLSRARKELTEWLKNVLYDAFKGVQKERGKLGSAEVCEESKKPYKPPESAFLVKKEDENKDLKEDTLKGTPGVPRHLKQLKEMEDRLAHAVQDTIQAFHAAVCALKEQGSLIDNLDQLINKHDCKVWDKLHIKMEEEQKYFDKAQAGMKAVEETANKLKTRLGEDPNLTEDTKNRAQNNLIIVMGDVDKAKETLEKEKAKMTLSKRSWDKVRQARMYFTEELETLFPNVWLNDEKLNLPMDSLDPFIQNVLSNIMFLQKELSKLQTLGDAEVNSAIDTYKSKNDYQPLVDAAVNIERSREKRLRQEEMQKSLLTHQAKCDKNARAQMKQQAEVYSDLRAEALSMKEREVERRMQQQLDERLAQVRAEHKMEIAKMVGRIQGANEAISQRGDKDKEQQEKQRLWSAAQSLLSAVKPIGASTKQKESKPLKNEITNVSKVAPEGDDFVQSVLDSIPSQAVERGVDTESKLKERFLTVEREARRVAAVPKGRVSLLQLFLARVQSALYIDEDIPQPELDNEPVDLAELNNYEVLYRARYYVDHGELDQAVRYLSLLKGPSWKVASDWIKDVVVYLETKQAAEVLLAYASALSLKA